VFTRCRPYRKNDRQTGADQVTHRTGKYDDSNPENLHLIAGTRSPK
jgi:hypothetical protein